MQTKLSTRLFSLIVCAVLIAAMALSAVSCGKTDPVSESAETSVAQTTAISETETAETKQELGEGQTAFEFRVTDLSGSQTAFLIHTDETTVGAALVNLGLIAGEDSEYGLYVKTVNGETVDYDTDGKYWAFYIDGEYAMTGVDATEIVPGSVYAFRAE